MNRPPEFEVIGITEKVKGDVRIEINKIHCIDCFEGIRQIPEKSVDCVIADPPYVVGVSSNARKGSQFEGFIIEPYFRDWIIEIKRVLRDTGSAYVFCDWRTYTALFRAFCNQMQIANCIVWDYGWIKAGLDYRYTHEFIIYLRKENAPRIKNRSLSDVWRIKPINFTVERNHNAEKPIDVIRTMLINSTEEGQLVLDPFIGSGTTAVACKQLNRNFIGFEINPEYIKIAEERLKSTSEQSKLTELAA
jgi:site-specific DNA-methyltransferase (adenine-specific)